MDVSDEEQVEALVRQVLDRYGRIDVLVNNAGVMVLSPLVDTESRRWDLIMRVNLRGPFLMCKYALPTMTAQHLGSIVNITSTSAISLSPGSAGYAVTKAGLNPAYPGPGGGGAGEWHRRQCPEPWLHKD